MEAAALKPDAATSLARWHTMLEARDLSGLPEISHPDVVFRSPAVHAPYRSAAMLQKIIGAAMQVFEDFAYHRQFVSADGLNVVLEFSAHIGDRDLKGIDMIRFDESGRIVEFEVMVRPMSGLTALAQAMATRLGVTTKG